MPTIYLSPSTQPYNLYATGGNEQQWMNRIADYMEPLLTAAGINFNRKSLEMSAADAIRAVNAGNYDLGVALHSNAAPESLAGTLRGIIVYYYPGSESGQRAANIIAEGLKGIYPHPELVRSEPTTAIGEVARTRSPTAFLEIGYHDNIADSQWIQANLELLAQNIVTSLSRYFNTPSLEPSAARPGMVNISWGNLNIREKPDVNANIIATATDGTMVSILNRVGEWYLIQFGNVIGYANADYILPV
ncbi:MAG: peptidoglycan hydrolase [Firmicutes bacterium]|nr:peptidoglycan hydrolase [Bacillota bacterium]